MLNLPNSRAKGTSSYGLTSDLRGSLLRYNVQFVVLFLLMSPWWAITSIVRNVRQRKLDRDFTWEAYWERRK